MNMLIKKRQLIMAALIVALGAAVFVNWYFTRTPGDISVTEKNPDSEYVQNLGEAKQVNSAAVTVQTTSDYFSEVKLERTKAHDKAVEDLKAAAQSVPVEASADKIAQSADELGAAIKLETDLETLIKAKLGGETVVIINGGKAQVVVAKGRLSDDAVLMITDIITGNTEIKPGDIKISEAK